LDASNRQQHYKPYSRSLLCARKGDGHSSRLRQSGADDQVCANHSVLLCIFLRVFDKLPRVRFQFVQTLINKMFLFCGRRSDRIKGLYWDNNGFILLYKRLEKGTFHWPRDKQEALRITAQQYEWLCMGFEIEARNKPVNTAGLRFS